MRGKAKRLSAEHFCKNRKSTTEDTEDTEEIYK
jgi:hypothetical protein